VQRNPVERDVRTADVAGTHDDRGDGPSDVIARSGTPTTATNTQLPEHPEELVRGARIMSGIRNKRVNCWESTANPT